MPARVIRGEINASDSLSRVSMQADLVFRALIVAVDDYGRIDGRLPILRGLLFPMRQEVTNRNLERWLEELAEGDDPCILRYEVDGRAFIALTGWEIHRGKGRRGNVSKCPEPLPRRSEEMHVNPPVGRESGDENREARDEKREAGAAPSALSAPRTPTRGMTPCPDVLDWESATRITAWASERGITQEQLAYGWDFLKDWARSRSKRQADWEAAFRNALRKGWCLEGFGAAGGKPAERESAAEGKVRRTKEAARRVLERVTSSPSPFALIPGGNP